MSRMTTLNSPYLLGFDGIERLLDRVSRSSGDGYPPYNIERLPQNGGSVSTLRITLAVSGFTPHHPDVQPHDSQPPRR